MAGWGWGWKLWPLQACPRRVRQEGAKATRTAVSARKGSRQAGVTRAESKLRVVTFGSLRWSGSCSVPTTVVYSGRSWAFSDGITMPYNARKEAFSLLVLFVLSLLGGGRLGRRCSPILDGELRVVRAVSPRLSVFA